MLVFSGWGGNQEELSPALAERRAGAQGRQGPRQDLTPHTTPSPEQSKEHTRNTHPQGHVQTLTRRGASTWLLPGLVLWFPPRGWVGGTFGNVRSLGCRDWERWEGSAPYGHLMGGGQGCCQTPRAAQDTRPLENPLTPMATVPKLRNPGPVDQKPCETFE